MARSARDRGPAPATSSRPRPCTGPEISGSSRANSIARGEREVLAKVAAVGICGSDVHYFEPGSIGRNVVRRLHVLGHEFSGRVTATGTSVATPGETGLWQEALPPRIERGTLRAVHDDQGQPPARRKLAENAYLRR